MNTVETRNDLLEYLGEIILTSLDKFNRVTAKNSVRQRWGNLAVKAISELNDILKDTEIEDLLRRIEALEGKTE